MEVMNKCLSCCRKSNQSKEDFDDSQLRVTVQLNPMEIGMDLSESEVKLIKEMHETLFNEKQCLDRSVDFLIMFFRLFPEYKKEFKAFKKVPIADLRSVPGGGNHGRKVLESLSKLIKEMDDPEALHTSLAEIFKNHSERKQNAMHLKDMLVAFVEFVSVEMGDSFTTERKEALEHWCLSMLFLLQLEEARKSFVKEDTSNVHADLNQNSSHDYELTSVDRPLKKETFTSIHWGETPTAALFCNNKEEIRRECFDTGDSTDQGHMNSIEHSPSDNKLNIALIELEESMLDVSIG